ncbi:MAG: phosphohydrolase, partial [Myxococcota bacterium]
SALIHPRKKLEAIDGAFVRKRFAEKHFARGADREQISACEDLGLTLDDFLDLSVRAMQEVSDELGL